MKALIISLGLVASFFVCGQAAEAGPVKQGFFKTTKWICFIPLKIGSAVIAIPFVAGVAIGAAGEVICDAEIQCDQISEQAKADRLARKKAELAAANDPVLQAKKAAQDAEFAALLKEAERLMEKVK